MNHGGVCRTAPATPGLLNTLKNNYIYVYDFNAWGKDKYLEEWGAGERPELLDHVESTAAAVEFGEDVVVLEHPEAAELSNTALHLPTLSLDSCFNSWHVDNCPKLTNFHTHSK